MSEELTKEDILNVTGSIFDTMLDYVDNSNKELEQLQQENKQLKEEIKQYQKELEKADSITQSCIFQGEEESGISFRNCLNKMTDYKTRIDKAIKYIKKNSELVKVDSKKHFDFYYREMKDVTELLEILKGDSNE